MDSHWAAIAYSTGRDGKGVEPCQRDSYSVVEWRSRSRRTLVYKRTHCGDPDPVTGVFGNHDCMGSVRGWSFDAVIGAGGCGHEPMQNNIARKLTWMGIGPHKSGDVVRPQVTLDHCLYYGEGGPLLEQLAPELARHLYEGGARVIVDGLPAIEQSEVQRILDLARDAPPSSHVTERAPVPRSAPPPLPAGRGSRASRCRHADYKMATVEWMGYALFATNMKPLDEFIAGLR